MLLIDLEPNGAITVEGFCRLTGWSLGHVELQGSWVLDPAVYAETNLVTSLYVLGTGAVGAGL